MSIQIVVKPLNINSKRLYADVDEFAQDVLSDNSEWSQGEYPENLVDLFCEFFEELAEESVVEQYKITCDDRNNRICDINLGIFNFQVDYKQWNCLNITKITYVINMKKIIH